MSGGRSRIPAVRFRVRGWLSREEFEELMKFCDYLGREEGESKFAINPKKAEENGYDIDEIREVLKKLGERVQRAALEVLEEEVAKGREVVIRVEGSDVVVEPRAFLGEALESLRDLLLKYDRKRKAFYAKPGRLEELIERLEALGFVVVDKTGVPKAQPLPERVEFKGELREYQKEALQAWSANKFRGIVALPTGAGKTVVGIAALSQLSEKTLIVVYTKEQLAQWMEKVLEFTTAPPSFVAPFYGEEKRLAPITISTYQTAYKYIDDLAFRFSFLVIDEVHHLPAEKFKQIALGMYSPRRMGLSATVVREDGKHVELFPLMGGVVYFKSPQELVEMGYLAPYVIKLVKVELTEEEKKRYEELRKVYKALSGGLSFKEIVARAQQGDRTAALALKVHSEMLQLIHTASRKLEAVKEIVSRELERGSKILVFTQYVEQAEELGRLLGAPVLTGSTEQKQRKKIFEEFRKAPKGVLVITTVGDEGIDIPDANVGVVVAGTGSRRQFIQRLGRLLRPGSGKVARLYEIVVKDTQEEAQAKRRRRTSLEDLMGPPPS